MEQIQLSPVKFRPSEIIEQENQLKAKVSLLINTVDIDEVNLIFFNKEADIDIEVQQTFCQIIQRPIPAVKNKQIQAIQQISFCFYSMLVSSKLPNISSIEIFFQKYMQKTTFLCKFVDCHEKVRKWCKQLLNKQQLPQSRHQLEGISQQITQANDKRLQIIAWKIKLCLILFDIMLSRWKCQRNRILAILKQFTKLKKQNKISTKPVLDAFHFIIQHLITNNSDLYIFFQRQVKIWCQEIVDNALIEQMKTIVRQCQQKSAKLLKQATFNMSQPRTNPYNISKSPQILTNAFIYASNNTFIGRSTKRRLSQQKSQQFKKKVDHFLKIRQNHLQKSADTPRHTHSNYKISIKLQHRISYSQNSGNRLPQGHSLINNGFKSKEQSNKNQLPVKQSSRVSLLASKTASSFYKKGGSRRKKQVYNKIMESSKTQNLITSKHLKDQMFSLPQYSNSQCRITIFEILMGEIKKSLVKSHNMKFKGASQDNQFGNLQFTFNTIFNQQLADISFSIKKVSKSTYALKCHIYSTYCREPTFITIEKHGKYVNEFTLDELFSYISNSVIYYEALQEKIDRKISISELQAMQELMREEKGIKLSQAQLTKLLLAVDLLQSQFFWYYTKSNKVNGTRIQRRININFTDLSAFAVSLGKFKSDYDSCLSEIVLVQNIRTLVETCIYLSHGRKIIYKQIRKIKKIFYLQVIAVSDSVYGSFSRKDKKPYFKNNRIERTLIRLDCLGGNALNESSLELFDFNPPNTSNKLVDLSQIFCEKDIFIIFMKNIVQNFIQIKYLYKIEQYLLRMSKQQNYQIFNLESSTSFQIHNLQILNNNESLQQIKNFKPRLHLSIRHLGNILLKYCQVYQLHPAFQIVKRQSHLLHIKKVNYFAEETILHNGLRILKIYRNNRRQNYNIFFYHQQPAPITTINTDFRTRFVMIDKDRLIGNLVRNQKRQMLLSEDGLSVTKGIVRYKKSYCYINVSECQSTICWRFDFYFIKTQCHYSTFVDEQTFFQCLGEETNNDQMWKQTLKFISIDLQNNCIMLHNRTFSLFRSIKKLFVSDDRVKSSLQLIEHKGQLQFLITNLQAGCLSLGKVENVMFLNNSKSQSSKQNIEIYNNIVNYLYYKMQGGKLQSEPISIDHFIKYKQN